MWYFEPRIERKKSRYRSTFLVRLLGSKYFIILALVGYLLSIYIAAQSAFNLIIAFTGQFTLITCIHLISH